MKNFILIILITFFCTYHAQVGINETSPKVTLDVKQSASPTVADGFLTVRMTGTQLAGKDNLYGADHNATVVYVTEVPGTATTKTSNINTPGFYYYNSNTSKWVGLNVPKFFYMPSVLFDTTTLGTKTKDLYQLYFDQFNTPAVSSAGSSGKVPVLGKKDLEYYITYYDTAVFSNVSIDANGLMSYTVNSDATDSSFMNIVFVVK